ncbi:MAG: hypothetical protein AVDCRST_MAG68-3246, partial [uncultured Gemmatimonadetes bacterium]
EVLDCVGAYVRRPRRGPLGRGGFGAGDADGSVAGGARGGGRGARAVPRPAGDRRRALRGGVAGRAPPVPDGSRARGVVHPGGHGYGHAPGGGGAAVGFLHPAWHVPRAAQGKGPALVPPRLALRGEQASRALRGRPQALAEGDAGHLRALSGRGDRPPRHQQARAAGPGRLARLHPHDQRSRPRAVLRRRRRHPGHHLL